MSRITLASGLCLLACLAYSCASPPQIKETSPVRIGLYADLSSTGAREGNDTLKGAELRVQQVNASGGLGGRRVELISMDMKQSTAEAVRAYTQLVQDEGVCAVIGPAVASSGVTVSPVADLAHVPLLSLSMDDRVTTPEMKIDSPDQVGTPRQFAFLFLASATQTAESLAGFTVDRFALGRYATVFDAVNPVSALQAHAFEAVVRKAGKTVVASLPLPQGDTAPLRQSLADSRPDAVYICASVEQNAAAAREVRASSPQAVLLGNQAWYAPLSALAGDVANNAWFSMPVSPEDPGFAEAGKSFSERYGDVLRPAAAAGWDAVGVVLAAVRRAGTTGPMPVRDALEQSTDVHLLSGQLDMDRKTHRAAFPAVAIMRIVGSTYRTEDARFVYRPEASH